MEKRSSTASSRASSTRSRTRETKIKNPAQKTIPMECTTETAVDQFELEKSRLHKKRELKNKQYDHYIKAVYGSPQAKEEIRKEQREGLLTQIKQREDQQKDTLKKKVKESETAVAYDKACLESDKQDHIRKAQYLKQFRDGNKLLIEQRAEERRRQREEENRRERELLKQNPLNWSNTLS